MAEMTAMQIINQFFGKKPGQTLPEFAAEIKALSDDEKEWIVAEAAKQLNVTVKKV